jgi:cytochrome b561
MKIVVSAPMRVQNVQPSPARFDAVSMALHWLTLALIVALFASAWLLGGAADGNEARSLLTIHRSLGVTTWVVTVCRLVWRWRFARTPALPPRTSTVQRRLAGGVHFLLLALLVMQPLTGLADTVFRGRPFALFIWQAPRFIGRDKIAAHAFHLIHEVGAFALLALIAGHTLAALAHRFVLRDAVLQSMAPSLRRKAEAAGHA